MAWESLQVRCSISNSFLKEFNNIIGTDMHAPSRGVNGWTTIIAKNFSEEAVWQELKERRTSFIYNATDSPYKAYATYTAQNWIYDPLFRVGNMLLDYYSLDRGIYSFVKDSNGNGIFCEEAVVTIQWDMIFVFIGT
jgi:hypothetical protein